MRENTTNRKVTLLPMTYENGQKLFPLFRKDIEELVRWFSFDKDYSLQDDYNTVDEQTKYEVTFIIYADNHPCGRVGLYGYDEEKNEIFMYYWVSSQYRHQHIASKGLAPALQYAKKLGIKQVVFEVDSNNQPSIHLLQQVVKIYDGERDGNSILMRMAL